MASRGEVMAGDKSECEASGDSGFKRNNYFAGKLLSEKDLTDEQEYYMGKRRLHNRLMHGWGVVCGLRVMPTSPPSRRISVEPGFAIDCAGNEMIITKPYVLDVSGIFRPRATKGEGSNTRGRRIEGPQRLYVVVEYCETPTDPVPALSTDGQEGDSIKYSRMSEGYRFDLMREGELPAKCAQVLRLRPAKRNRAHEVHRECPIREPRCCECPFVILAAITWKVHKVTITGDMIKAVTNVITTPP